MHVFLTNKPYQNLLVASFFNEIGSVMFNIVFIIYAGNLPYKTLAVTLVTIANFVPNLFEIPSGYLADNTTQRLRTTLVLRMVQFGLYLLLAFLIGFSQSIGVFTGLLLINIVSDIISNYTGGLVMPYYKHFVSKKDLADAAGFNSGIGNIISIVFQGLGASLIVLIHQNYALFGIINACSFLVAGLLLLWQRHAFAHADQQDTIAMTLAKQNGTAKNEHFFKSIGHSLRIVHADQSLFAIIILILGANTLFSASDGLTNVLLTTQKQLWLNNYGTTIALINITGAIGMAAGAIFMGDIFQKMRVTTLIGLCLVITLLYSINMFAVQSFSVMIVLSAMQAYLIGKLSPRLSAQVINTMPQNRLAATESIVSVLFLIGTPVGQSVFLTLANLTSPALTWRVFTVCALVGIGASVLTRQHLQRTMRAVETAQQPQKISPHRSQKA